MVIILLVVLIHIQDGFFEESNYGREKPWE